MTWNLLMWKWSDEQRTAPRKRKPKFSEIVEQFSLTQDHPMFADMNFAGFKEALEDRFGMEQDHWPFVLEIYSRCVVVNYPNDIRFEIVPVVAEIGKRFELNASEF